MFKKLRNFKVIAIIMFFALCVPSVAYGDYENITNSSELNSGNEVAETNATEPTETSESSNFTETETNNPGVTDKKSIVGDEQEESILDEPDVVEPIEEIPVKEETQPNEELKVLPPIQIAEQVILTSVEDLPSETIIEFTLDGVRVGLVSNGLITDALPILATDKQRVKACVLNKIRIVGAKINFDTYKPTEQLPIIAQPIIPPEPIKPVEVEQEKPDEVPIAEEPVETEEPIEEELVTEPDDGNIDKDIEGDVTESEDNEGTTEDGTTDGVIKDDEKTVSEGNENVAESEDNKGTTDKEDVTSDTGSDTMN